MISDRIKAELLTDNPSSLRRALRDADHNHRLAGTYLVAVGEGKQRITTRIVARK